jgi:cation transporter-like permease
MKKISFIVLLVSIGIILYLFIKEQFKGMVLSHRENMVLSVTYLLVGIPVLILFRLKNIENKKQDHLKK